MRRMHYNNVPLNCIHILYNYNALNAVQCIFLRFSHVPRNSSHINRKCTLINKCFREQIYLKLIIEVAELYNNNKAMKHIYITVLVLHILTVSGFSYNYLIINKVLQVYFNIRVNY